MHCVGGSTFALVEYGGGRANGACPGRMVRARAVAHPVLAHAQALGTAVPARMS